MARTHTFENFKSVYLEVRKDFDFNGEITKKSKCTSLFYVLECLSDDYKNEVFDYLITDARDNNHPFAQFVLGMSYYYGYKGFVRKNFAQSKKWFALANAQTDKLTNTPANDNI